MNNNNNSIREYAREEYNTQNIINNNTINFIKNTYLMFGLTMIISFFGALLNQFYFETINSIYLYLLLFQISIIFFMKIYRKIKYINILILVLFSFLNGILSIHILNFLLKGFDNNFLLMNIFLMSGIIFSIVSVFKLKNENDINNYKPLYFIIFLVMSSSYYINLYIYEKTIISIAFSFLNVVLITISVISHSKVLKQEKLSSDIEGTIQLYFDFLLMFKNIWNSFTKFD